MIIVDKIIYAILKTVLLLLSFIVKILDFIFAIFRIPLPDKPYFTSGPLIQSFLSSQLSPIRSVEVSGKNLKFDCSGIMSLYRGNTAGTKEPETISWINSYANEKVLWDIGANVGVYSMYAGASGLRVLALEPSAPNYYVLNKNIKLNSLDDRVKALSLAMFSETNIASLHMGDTELGGAFNSCSESSYSGMQFDAVFLQGTLGITIDQLAEIGGEEYFPNILKIDVDGNELKIIQGAKKTLLDQRLKSILIELTDANNELGEVTELLKEAGFTLGKTHEIGHLKSETDITIRNCIYTR